MKILAIESSCDETAAAVVEDGRKVLSSKIASQVEEHKIYGGVVPEIASRRHAEAISGIVKAALEEANITLDDIDAVGHQEAGVKQTAGQCADQRTEDVMHQQDQTALRFFFVRIIQKINLAVFQFGKHVSLPLHHKSIGGILFI